MRTIACCFWAHLLFISTAIAQRDTLFRIKENGKFGFVDTNGNLIIPAKFYAANDFYEGLAAVRENGHYGFVNVSGQYIIQPQFEQATVFHHGTALVMKQGQIYVVDLTGKPLFPPVFQSFQHISSDKVIVQTSKGKMGLLGVQSRMLFLDTVYDRLNAYGDVLIAEKEQPDRREGAFTRYAVFDTLGRAIVPFGKYERINSFEEGFAVVSIKTGRKDEYDDDGAIDKSGNLVYRRPKGAMYNTPRNFRSGLSHVIVSRKGKEYNGYINLRGQLVFEDSSYWNMTDFTGRRAFLANYDSSLRYYCIDTAFRKLSEEAFESIDLLNLTDQYMVVEKGGAWGIIDTNARFVVPPKYHTIKRLYRDYFVYESKNGLFGVTTLDGQIIIPPVLQNYDWEGFVHGLLGTKVDGRITYYNRQGNIVWQESIASVNAFQRLNIDYVAEANYKAYDFSNMPDTLLKRRWLFKSGYPTKTLPSIPLPLNRLSLILDTNRIDTFGNRYRGFPVYLTNTTADTMQFRGQDHRMSMILQAQDSAGLWHNIQCMPYTFCGNSFHRLSLDPAAHWKFVVPDYEGTIPVLMRLSLQYYYSAGSSEQRTMYSNTWRGSVNPAQIIVSEPAFPLNDFMFDYF